MYVVSLFLTHTKSNASFYSLRLVPPIRMAAIAGITLIDIIPHSTVMTVHGRLPVLMTANTGEDRKIPAVRMALRAGIPLIPVRSGIDREIHPVMIEI